MSQEIQLVQLPIIKHAVKEVGKLIDERLKALNIEGQVATIDTIKSLKDLRADLNKELKEYETQRTLIKKQILSPYDEFENIYKKEVKEKIEKAVEILKDKITSVEDELRKTKTDNIINYFNELCETKKIDFLIFEQTGIEINLSTPDKQYKERCIEFINKVADDLELIETQKDKTEILVEYKISLNAARSIKTVQERKAAIEEAERQEAANKLNKRIQIILSLGFEFDEESATYKRDNDLLSYNELEKMPKEDFILWTLSHQQIKNEPIIENLPKHESDDNIVFIDPPKSNTPVLQTITYVITGTGKQIENLNIFLKENNIKYKSNI